MDASRRITQAIERFLRAHADEMHFDHDPALAAVIIETVGEALSHRAVLEGRNSLTHEAIHREAFSVMVNCLRQPKH